MPLDIGEYMMFALMFFGLAIVGLVLLVPLAGLALRLGLKPLVESWSAPRQRIGGVEDDVLHGRVEALEAQLQRLRERIESVEEGRDFERLLAEVNAPTTTSAARPATPADRADQ